MSPLDQHQARDLLEQCRGEGGSLEKARQLVDFLVNNGGIDLMEALETSRMELQRLLWKYSDSTVPIADPRLVRKKRSGSSFDRGGYNFG